MKRYRAGKLPPDALRALLRRYAASGDGLAVGPGVGLDAAAVECRGSWVVAAADPITFTADSIGRYAVHVNANDVACQGARPRWFLATVLLPEGSGEGAVESIFGDIAAACAEVGAGLCGGHTEITPGLPRPIVAGTMLGECIGPEPITPRTTRPGDVLLLTKGIAIEGTAILARDFGGRLEGHVPDALLRRARGFLDAPGLSVVRDALTALEAGAGAVHGLHDPTEGGLALGVREMAEAAGVGFRVRLDAIPIFEETRAICGTLGVDPLGLLASGALLITVAAERAENVRAALKNRGIASAAIGVAVVADGVTVEDGATSRAWPVFERDEFARLLDAPPPFTLLYDGDCAFCRTWVERIRARDTRHRIALIPFQSVDPASYGVRRSDLEEAMHLVGPDGVWRGAAAAREVLALLPRWRWASWLFRVPGVLPAAERAYNWIARRRHRFSCGSGVCRRGES